MIYILRHGQTARNKEKVLQGRSNAQLNETGIQQAEEVKDRFKAAGISFDKVYSSPLIRAVQTAGIVAEDVPLTVDERLIEIDYGPYEGMDMLNPYLEVLDFFKDFVHVPAPEGMEPLQEVVARMGRFLEEIREEAVEGTILIATHAIAMKGALEYLTPESKGGYWSKFVANCAVYSAETFADGTWSVPVLWEGPQNS